MARSAASVKGIHSSYPTALTPAMHPALRAFSALAIVLLQGCVALPSLDGRTPSARLHDTADTRLGRSIAPIAQAHPGLSGVVPLISGRDAFAARVRLAEVAERSLDVQYYLWRQDLSGTLLFDALRRAAERGVRVRLLVDDNNTGGVDGTLAALDAQPNIEVRLFNPFATRQWRALGFVLDFARLNRRMHNKSFTADNQATVIGGRNVGDEYFGASEDVLFVDLDVLAIGPVVDDVSQDFDRYWASASSYPARRLLAPAAPEDIATLAAAAATVRHEPAGVAYLQSIDESPFMRRLLARSLEFEWTQVHLVSDDPAKGLGLASNDELMWSRLKRVMKRPTRDLELVSPYFVPGAQGVEFFGGMARRGVKLNVLTNSFEATDVSAVHAGYAKRRRALLEAGVGLFEMKRDGSASGAGEERSLYAGSGSSAASLHAKTFSVDGAHVFIGSFNFDPRSARLNTEMAFVIDSPALARSIADIFAGHVRDRAYEVQLAADGSLRWVEHVDGKPVVHDQEPGMTFWKRLGVSLLSLLPIDWLL
jgi:putative cardiolipin synthase